MNWSYAQCRQAAARVRQAPLGRQAVDAVRPRGVAGLLRTRAPLPLLLYVAARDGLVVPHERGGFALLQRPAADRPTRSGGYRLRLLRWLDRRFDLLLFVLPAVLCLLFALCAVPWARLRTAAILALLLTMVWVCVVLTGLLLRQLAWVASLGGAATAKHSRQAESLPGNHWSVPLLHCPAVDRTEQLISLLTDQLTWLIHADLQTSAGDRARVAVPELTETLVILTNGVTTSEVRAALAQSIRALREHPGDGGVIVLSAPGRPRRVPARPVTGGGFLLLYGGGLALVLAVSARVVADTEARACRATGCAGRPASYRLAVQWLLQRLLLHDGSGLSAGTVRDSVLGWLFSLAALMFVVVAYVAVRAELGRNRASRQSHDEAVQDAVDTARVLILVVTPGEREAVKSAVRAHVGRDPVVDHSGHRTIHRLGTISGTELLLAQAGEQGTASAAGMLLTARDTISATRPDYVILTGICYGLRPAHALDAPHAGEGQRLGDIVVARRVRNIDHTKRTDVNGVPETRYRGVNAGPAPGLLDRFQAAESTWGGVAVHVGTVLTGNTVVNSRSLVDYQRSRFPEAIAGEMEGTGVYEAASTGNKPDWIMAKGISDWGYGKTDRAQALAARNVAEFLTHVVASGALRRPRSDAAP